MQMKTCSILFLATLLLACKPEALAETQSTSTSESAVSSAEELETGEAETTISAEIRKRAPDGITQEYLNCMDQALGTIEIAACISDEDDRQDARLNGSYRMLRDLLDDDRKKRLIEAQREWLVLQEKDGSFEAMLFENTQPENLAGAEREMFYVAERADRIQEWLEMVNAN